MEPTVDLRSHDPIPHSHTLTIVNNFVIRTTQFINIFSRVCEEKLQKISRDCQRMETVLSILEAKLNSIPELQGVSSGTTSAPNPPPPSQPSAPPPGSAPAPPPPPPALGAPPAPEAPPAPPASDPSVVLFRNDPAYTKYYTMIRVGVPDAQVKMRMQTEGLDPQAIDNPDAPSTTHKGAAGGDSSDSDA
eukprot:c7296_g1_i2.p1 GENE.c7296_g1_i2~~c7296_g1_i2.p1  ORF type:complete len:200 (+),score=40.75 c7296_g1_i2:33-602(+)